MAVIDMVVNHLVGTRYEALPPDVVGVTKKQILDTLAAAIGGSTCSISGELNGLVELVKEWGGKEESTILGFGGRARAPNAAFVNGILCTRRDFDDTQVSLMHIHPSRAIVPTAFAMAERQGSIGGKEFVTAVVLGHDLECRIRQAGGHDVESSFGTVTSFLGAAGTAGKILGFSNEKLKSSLGLAFHQVSGAMGGMGTAGAGASVKGVNNGLAAKAGILSALLADKGFTAGSGFLEPENKKNLYDLFFGGYYWPWLLTLDLGKIFAGSNTSQKEFPCCHGQHTALRATLALLREQDIRADDVAGVMLHVSPLEYVLLGEPLEKKQNPQNIIEAQFSLCWGVASALVYREVGIRNFSEDALGDTRVRGMARKIVAQPKVELTRAVGFTPTIVEVRTKDGKVYTRQVEYPFGSPQDPMSFADVAAKFRYCCQYSTKPITEENQDKVIGMIQGLEEVDDVREIISLLA